MCECVSVCVCVGGGQVNERAEVRGESAYGELGKQGAGVKHGFYTSQSHSQFSWRRPPYMGIENVVSSDREEEQSQQTAPKVLIKDYRQHDGNSGMFYSWQPPLCNLWRAKGQTEPGPSTVQVGAADRNHGPNGPCHRYLTPWHGRRSRKCLSSFSVGRQKTGRKAKEGTEDWFTFSPTWGE